MGRRRMRLGIRAQLTLVVLLGAILSTAATLFIANNAIQQYAAQQAQQQEKENMKIAILVLQTEYGQNISIAYNGNLVVDSPTTGKDLTSSYTLANQYGKYPLDSDTDYVDEVKNLIGGAISVYKCATPQGAFLASGCTGIATTLQSGSTAQGIAARQTGQPLGSSVLSAMGISNNNEKNIGANPHEWTGIVTLDGKQYYTDYYPMRDPQGNFIGVLSVGTPLDTVTSFQQSTTIQLLLLGLIIMIAGIIFSLLFASTIVNTLQRVARQVNTSSERLTGIAAQQSGGAEQQVWAVNSINKALQNFAEMARDISHRTDQLALMGNQVIQRRAEITPIQIDSILAYMTRSVRDISVASRQEASQYERMTGAMQAVIEIADQVAAGSQQASDSAERLDEIVGDLQQLVGVRRRARTATRDEAAEAMAAMPAMSGGMSGMGQPQMMGARAMANANGMGMRGAGPRIISNANMGGMNIGRMPEMVGARAALPPGPMQGTDSGGLGGRGRMGGMGGMGGPMGPMGQMNPPTTGRGNSWRGSQQGNMGMGGMPAMPETPGFMDGRGMPNSMPQPPMGRAPMGGPSMPRGGMGGPMSGPMSGPGYGAGRPMRGPASSPNAPGADRGYDGGYDGYDDGYNGGYTGGDGMNGYDGNGGPRPRMRR